MSQIIIDMQLTGQALQTLQRFKSSGGWLERARRSLLKSQGDRLLDLTRQEAPGRTFPEDIEIEHFGRGEAIGFRLIAPHPPARFITEGTRPHEILPRFASVLAFDVGGTTIFARRVQHPGTSPNRFPGRAYRRWLPGFRPKAKGLAREFTRFLAGGIVESKSMTL